jgi:prolyl 4-hydroxylase
MMMEGIPFVDRACILLYFCFLLICHADLPEESHEYDCFSDVSWAIRTPQLSTSARQAVYDEFMENCRVLAGDNADVKCDDDEASRLRLNTFQPQSMYNFTATGFTKRRVPDELRRVLEAFWEENSENGFLEAEQVSPYHNTWITNPSLVNLHDTTLIGGGAELAASVFDAVRPIVEEWTGMRQSATSVYGIRVYLNGSILAPHVDRWPLVSSVIINVAQDVETPWVLEVYDHDGRAHNVTMEPWDMILYESHSVIHGRPFPMDGAYFANAFVHFEPIGPLEVGTSLSSRSKKDLPPYIVPGSAAEKEWRSNFPDGWTALKGGFFLAQEGDVTTLKQVVLSNPSIIRVEDSAGWQPIHEAARFGHLDVLRFLIEEQGIDVATPTVGGKSPLSIAQSNLAEGHPVIDYLLENWSMEADEQYPPVERAVIDYRVAESQNESPYDCFADFSWAIGSQQLSTPERQAMYDEFMEKCREAAGDQAYELCDKEEAYRFTMNNLQPQSMYNYSATGFTKGRVPEELRSLLQAFWDDHFENGVVEWEQASPYHNLWNAQPELVNVNNIALKGGGPELAAAVASGIKPTMEEWTGMRQAVTSVYGIRVYYNESILAPHVDRLPLVSSVIINVAQDVETPWVLEVFDHDGRAHNVTMEPWDMVLYESHSVIHGRPFPMDGTFFANVFVHFEPIGPLETDADLRSRPEAELPPYIIPDSPWEKEWRSVFPDGWTLLKDAPILAQKGDIGTLRHLALSNPSSLRVTDSAGWQPIHEAARAGHVDVLRFFIEEQGIHIGTPTLGGKTPLSIAQLNLAEGHPVIDYLVENGALEADEQYSPDKPSGARRSTVRRIDSEL